MGVELKRSHGQSKNIITKKNATVHTVLKVNELLEKRAIESMRCFTLCQLLFFK